MAAHRLYFPDKLLVSPLDDQPGCWVIEADFRYYIEIAGPIILIQKGEITDFASIPKFLHPVLPPYHPDYGKPAIVHDHLYKHQYYSRYRSDKIFLTAMQRNGTELWKRRLIFWAVRAFGWTAWKTHRMQRAKAIQ